MDELLKAIKNEYNTADGGSGPFTLLRAANTGGLYITEHLQEQALPYMVLHHIGSTPDYFMGGAEIKTSVVQFSIFDDVPSVVMNILGLLRTAFDDTVLAYTADRPVIMQRINEVGPIKELNFWQVAVDYQVMRAT